jgi:hypothetical protein
MTVPALLLALAAILICVLTMAGLFLLRRPAPPALPEAVLSSLAEFGSLRAQVESVTAQQAGLAQTLAALHGAVQGVETRILESSAGVKDALGREMQEARVAVERLKADAEARRRLDEEVQASARRIENVLLGSRTRGAAGENILQEAFSQFPADMIQTNFRVNGKVVEYALILANSRRLPIDSKWPSPELIERLSDGAATPEQQAALVGEVERVLKAKVREVRQYIDPSTTLSWAVAAVPDPIFNACRRGHLEAFREGVVLMPYSMTIPYLLGLFRLHLQYARSVDLENLEGYLQQIEECVTAIDRSLENSIARGSTMVQNAYSECKRNVGQLRGALAGLRAIPENAVVEGQARLRLVEAAPESLPAASGD